jgi:hypothetical protein
MASARVENPQSMNRYSYTTNNPLKYSDPSGLYQWSADLGGNDDDTTLIANANAIKDKKASKAALKRASNIIEKRNKFRNAMIEAAKAGASSNNPAKVANAIAAYGKEYENNGVVVTFGENAGNDPGVTTGNGTNISDISSAQDGSKVRAEILVTFDNDTDTENLILSVAHEGQHVADRQTFANAWNSLAAAYPGGTNGDPNRIYTSAYDVTHRTSETRAYTVSALVAQGRGLENLNYTVGNTNYEIYSRGGGINMQRINDYLNASPTYNTKLNDRIIRP